LFVESLKKYFTKLLLCEAAVGLVALIVVEVFPNALIGIFGAKNESIYYTEFALKAFRIYLCMMIFACVNKATFFFLQAMGKAVSSTMLSMIREIVFGVGFALLLPLFFGLDGLKVLYNSRMESGHLIGTERNRWRMLAQSVIDFLRHPAFGMGLGNTTNRRIYAGVPGSMFFYHNAVAQIIGSMGLMGAAAYACLIRDRVNLLWQGRRDPFVAMLAISYLGMLLVSMTNPGEFCPFPNASMMVMLFAMAEDAVGDAAVPVLQLRSRRGVRRLVYMLTAW
jgi:hypothetical protein